MATIKDVAKKAGVSIGVVSKAFNNYPDISEKTKQRILEVAKELNYSPNVVAKNLSSKKQNTIGMISSGFFHSDGRDHLNSFELFKGIYTATQENGYEFAIYITDSIKQMNKSYTQFCRERNIGGVVLFGIRTDDPYLKELIDSNIPCILVDVLIDKNVPNIGSVSTDNRKAAKEVASYLLDHHHHDLMVVAGKEKTFVNSERLQGVKEALEERGSNLTMDRILHGNFSEEEAYVETLALLEKRQPSAFLCFSDLMAIGVMRAVKEKGLRIPEDVSVTGFDGLILTEYVSPPLTTVKQNFFEMGLKAAVLIQHMLEGERYDTNSFVDHLLVKRESVRELHKS